MLTQKGCLILGPRLILSSITLALPGEAASEGIIPGYIAFYIIWILALIQGAFSAVLSTITGGALPRWSCEEKNAFSCLELVLLVSLNPWIMIPIYYHFKGLILLPSNCNCNCILSLQLENLLCLQKLATDDISVKKLGFQCT